ncbi:MAG: hypothetical protein FWC62_01175 [Firmicutes bacterium]|nr:hypothetical protein [Bacillota bacterium]
MIALFKFNYSRPGPGVDKDEPRKKGVRRFAEVLLRDFGAFVRLNLIFCVCALPSAALFTLGLLGFYSSIMLPLSLVASVPIGGAMSACMFFVTKRLRDDPGYVWDEFKRKFAETFKRAMIPGMLCTVFVYGQIYFWSLVLLGGVVVGLAGLLAGAISLLIFGMIAPYFYLQIAYIDLPAFQIFKNSVLISLSHAPRSLMGSLMGGLIWIGFVLYLPVSLVAAPLILLFGFSLSWLLTLMWVWPPVDKQFAIEETLRKRYAEELEEHRQWT